MLPCRDYDAAPEFGLVYERSHRTSKDNPGNTWMHNGSVVHLEFERADRKIRYLFPREGMQQQGARRDTLLFDGRRVGYDYVGTAYIFKNGYQPAGYSVRGSVNSELNFIRMVGQAPRLDDNCNITGYRDDILTFSTHQLDPDCGCECPGEIPVADVEEWARSGAATSCPYLYAWDDAQKFWAPYGKVIHAAQGKKKETSDEVILKAFATKFRLSEEEPENAFINFVQLRVELRDGSIILLKPNIDQLVNRDDDYVYIPAFQSKEVEFSVPTNIKIEDVIRTTFIIAGYYERLPSIGQKRAQSTIPTKMQRVCFPGAKFRFYNPSP
jgi:hypothetical protein